MPVGQVRGRSSRILPRVLQLAQDCLDDRLGSLEDIMIPKAEHEITLPREVRRAFLVTKRRLRFVVRQAHHPELVEGAWPPPSSSTTRRTWVQQKSATYFPIRC